jgi:hypothetical protein
MMAVMGLSGFGSTKVRFLKFISMFLSLHIFSGKTGRR